VGKRVRPRNSRAGTQLELRPFVLLTAFVAYRLPAYPLTRLPTYFSSPFAIVCSCMLLVPS
jgi:hypothetical protein